MNYRGFHLTKWYADCVSEEGLAFIGYCAKLRYKGVSISYSSRVLHTKENGTVSKTSLLDRSLPHQKGNTVTWNSSSLKILGTWESLSKPVEKQLYSNDNGTVLWNCIQPLSKACVEIDNNTLISGYGYAEMLTLSLAPWQLPIDELRWGRFLCEGCSLVWIDWRGNTPLSLVFYNGIEINSPSISDDHVSAQGLDLNILKRSAIREGPVFSTALSMVPGIKALCPEKILGMEEYKWLSAGTLSISGGIPVSGSVIHEVVRF